MAVTDLTDSLPYWARQGVGYPGGPGPTGGPGSAPMGAGNSASWLQYLQQMFGPDAAQAADNPQIAALKAAAAAQANGAPPQAGPGDVPVPQSVASLQPTPQAPGPTQNPTPWFNSGNTPLPWNGPPVRTPATAADPNAPAPNASPVSAQAPAPTPGPLASGGATASGASANPRFVGISAPNMSPQNSMRGGPQGTALNLAGLFGGGAPGAPRGVNPANLPAPAAQPVSGPLAGGGRLPGGRYINPQPPGGPPDYGMAPVDITGYPVAGVNATRSPDMTPDQLASAVKKRNWYRNV